MRADTQRRGILAALRPGELALHRCDTANCWATDSIFVGRYRDNGKDSAVLPRGRVRCRVVMDHDDGRTARPAAQ